MWRFLMCALLISQAANAQRPSILAKSSDPPGRNFRVIYHDDAFLFAGRNYGSSTDPGGNTAPGLFVHAKDADRWIQVMKISTAGGRFGKSTSDDPEERKRLMVAQVGWDFTHLASAEYADQPMSTGSSIVFPERVTYLPDSGRYELRYLTSWRVPSAETVLYINRSDLVAAFARVR